MTISQLIQKPFVGVPRSQYCAMIRRCFLAAAFLGLAGQVLYDRHLVTVVSLFPQWLLLGSIWYAWRRNDIGQDDGARGTLILALLIPALSCLTLLIAWLGWKANTLAIGGVIPLSDSASYYISAQTFLRESFLDPSGQRRPLNIMLTSLWLYLSGDEFKLLLLIQALGFSAAAFLASAAVAAVHGFRAGLLLFALLLVFAEPYLPTVMSETNGMIFGVLSLVLFLFGVFRRSLFSFCFGAFLLAVGLAIRPSAILILPCVVVAGAVIYGNSRARRLTAIASVTTAVLLPMLISIFLNKTMSHGDGAFNSNLSYTIYGLVSGGKGWEQYQRDNPRTLDGLTEIQRSHVILEAAKQHFKEHPVDLAKGLIKAQMLGPLQTFAQIVRLAFLGAAGDPLRIIPPAAIIAGWVLFAGVLACQWTSRKHGWRVNSNFRVFCILLLIGYLVSIPFFYIDGGLRLHAAVLPIVSYLLVRVLMPSAGVADENAFLSANASRVLTGATTFGLVLLGLVGWIALVHPKSPNFAPIPVSVMEGENNIIFRFEPGWPRCNLRNFDRPPGYGRPRWFSGAIPDDDYRSAGIREIAGKGYLYFGFDSGARVWKIIHTDQPVGLLNRIEVRSGNPEGSREKIYRDFYSSETVQVIGATPAQ
jgi:hypothetical protein